MSELSIAASAVLRPLVAATVALAIAGAAAKPQALPTPPAEPGSELTVSLITLGQGDQVWERFGHNALWIHDAARGTDRTYNWGVFDASDAGFILRFVRGRMRYWMESVDVDRLFDFYRSSDRTITVQRLALSPAQRVAIRDFAEWNAREENKYYWYDYFRDNCSTRVRDAVDRAVGGALRAATTGTSTRNTYRSESVRLMEGMPITQTGIALGLGPLSDRPLTAWEEMFVPMRMRDRLREVRIAGPDGAPTPLVADERQVYVSRRPPEPQQPPSLLRRYATIGALAGLVIAALGFLAYTASGAPFTAAATTWAVLSGVGGLLLLFLWLGTHHLFAFRNHNLLQVNPLAIVLAVVAPLAVHRPRLRAAASWLAATLVAASLVGLALKAIPGLAQDNLAVIAAVLPGHLALAWAFRRLARRAVTRGPGAGADEPAPPVVARDAAIRRASAS